VSGLSQRAARDATTGRRHQAASLRLAEALSSRRSGADRTRSHATLQYRTPRLHSALLGAFRGLECGQR